jgi:hypothetical protein
MFAAAALAGLMSDSPDTAAQDAYRIADAMLRERALRAADAAYTEGVSASSESKNHDAASAARASEAEKQAVGRRAETIAGEAGTGDTRAAQEPAAWGVYRGDDLVMVCKTREVAAAWMRKWPERNSRLVPLYAAPPAGSVTLTDEERRELEAAAIEYQHGAEKIVYGRPAHRRRAATIRGLLARAGGQTSGHDSPAQSQPAPENTPACDAQEPAKQAVTLTDAEREAVRECADIARSQLWSAREGGDEETIARWMQRLARITGLLARAAKEGR